MNDVQIMLDHTTGLFDLDSLAVEVGDVTGNNIISNLDAAISLLYLGGFIAQLPPENCCDWATASGDIILENQNVDPGMQLQIPIILSNASNIYGFTGTINYDPNLLSLDTLEFSESTNNYLGSINLIDPGMVRISAAGIESLQDSLVFLTITLNVSDNFSSETIVSITDFSWNEGEVVDLAAEMVIGYGLDIQDASIPLTFSLYQNYPNPFNPYTTIRYDIPENVFVNVSIYDMMGKMINNLIHQHQSPGPMSVVWDGTNTKGENVAAGVYIYIINAGNFHQTKKMILLK